MQACNHPVVRASATHAPHGATDLTHAAASYLHTPYATSSQELSRQHREHPRCCGLLIRNCALLVEPDGHFPRAVLRDRQVTSAHDFLLLFVVLLLTPSIVSTASRYSWFSRWISPTYTSSILCSRFSRTRQGLRKAHGGSLCT